MKLFRTETSGRPSCRRFPLPAACTVLMVLFAGPTARAADVMLADSGTLTWIGLNLNTVVSAAWIFILGSCVGSFLNVVIYRLPAGMALTHPGSRCPVCGTELTARDNIPILGWLSLLGRCRYCRTPISSRYPLIETVTGLLFLAVFLLETHTAAHNLPFRRPIHVHGSALDLILGLGYWELAGWFFAHTYYLTVVLALCMIALDGHRPPRGLVVSTAGLALLMGIVWPGLRPVPLWFPPPGIPAYYWGVSWTAPSWLGGRPVVTGIGLRGILEGAAGLISGWLAGRQIRIALGARHPTAQAAAAVLLLTGCWCGWQLPWALLLLMLPAVVLLKWTVLTNRLLLPLLVFAECSVLLLGWAQLTNGRWLIRCDGWYWFDQAPTTDWGATVISIGLVVLLLSRFPTPMPAANANQSIEETPDLPEE